MSLMVFIPMFILFILPIGIFLRFLDLGLKKGHAFHLTFIFPIEIVQIHFNIYKHLRSQDKKKALKLLFAPITNLPEVIVSYAEMHINMHAKFLAIQELLTELNDKEIRKMSNQLKKQGFIIKRKKIKQAEQFVDDSDSIKKYMINLGFKQMADLY